MRPQQEKETTTDGEEEDDAPYQINIVVYSTGALILRHFLRTYYHTKYRHKIRRVVMFAPDNYGSPFAKKVCKIEIHAGAHLDILMHT